jgi:hypothetical protein
MQKNVSTKKMRFAEFLSDLSHQDEDPALGAGGGLAHAVADLRDLVERRVRAQAEVGARNVVAGEDLMNQFRPQFTNLRAKVKKGRICM